MLNDSNEFDGDEGQAQEATQPDVALVSTLKTLRETHRRRVDLMRASTKLTLQIKAVARRMCDGDKTEANTKLLPALEGKGDHPKALVLAAWVQPLLESRALIETHRKAEEKTLEKLAKSLPIAEWVDQQKGLGHLSVGGVIGELGDLNDYTNPAKIWKRMGLAVINGGRQRKVANAEEALLHGYSPQRRSMMWNIGAALIKQQGPWRELYLHRLAVEHQKALDEGLIPATSTAATVLSWEARGLPALTKITKPTAEHRTAGHMNARSQRYIEKRLLRDMWKAWRQA